MRRVLVPLNLSDLTDDVLHIVSRLFHAEDVELTLLGVIQKPESAMSAQIFVGDIFHAHCIVPCTEEEWQCYRQRFVVKLKRMAHPLRTAGYRVDTLVRVGEPVEQILNAVAEGSYDLVALATEYETPLMRFLFGSLVDTLSQRLSLPLLFMRTDPAGQQSVVSASHFAAVQSHEPLPYEPSLSY